MKKVIRLYSIWCQRWDTAAADGSSWKVMEAFKNSMTQYVANATIWKEIIVEQGKLFHKKPLKMARKGHVTSEMARKGHVSHVIKGRTTATGRRQHGQCMATRARPHQQH